MHKYIIQPIHFVLRALCVHNFGACCIALVKELGSNSSEEMILHLLVVITCL